MTNDEIASLVLADAERRDALYAATANWLNGTATGGPNSDGLYPVPIGPGTTRLVPSPDRIRFDASKLVFERIGLSSGSTITLTEGHSGKVLMLAGTSTTSNITVVVPGSVPVGWGCVIIQEGTGGPRVTVSIGSTAGGQTAFLRSRGSVYRLADQWAQASLTCVARDSSSRSTVVLAGDIIQ
jgi:hypothetical protein